MAKSISQKTDEEILRESGEWDKLSVEEMAKIWNDAEPVDIDWVYAPSPKKAISIRIREDVIEDTKRLAAHFGLGYQALFKLWIADGLDDWRRRYAPPRNRRTPRRSPAKSSPRSRSAA